MIHPLSSSNPERYLAIVVEDLFENVGKEALHVDGEPTKEYLGMLSLYAIHRASRIIPENQPYGKLVHTLYESFDPESMSEKYVQWLTDFLKDRCQADDLNSQNLYTSCIPFSKIPDPKFRDWERTI